MGLTFADLQFTSTGADTVLDLGNGDEVLFANISDPLTFSSTDFLFFDTAMA